MRTHVSLVAALLAGVAGLAAADEPNWSGKVGFDEVPLKVYPARGDEKPGVEVRGFYKEQTGWEAKKVVLNYIPRAGGSPKDAKADDLKLADGKFGAVDPKTKKMVPARVSLPPGKWTVRVIVNYEREEDGEKVEVPVQTSWEHVEVK